MGKQKRSYSMYDIKTRESLRKGKTPWKTLVAGITKSPAALKFYKEYVETGRGDFKLVKLTVSEHTIRTTVPLKKGKKNVIKSRKPRPKAYR